MKRDLTALGTRLFDVLVIGGGIYGACVAYEATQRGLSVALVEKDDFGAATSANSLKIIHGGFRYLQHADLARIRTSSGERTRLMAMAPHLVHPLPVVLPAYGYGLRGREAYALALVANDLLTYDRNQLADPAKQIPRGHVLSRQACLSYLPAVPTEGLRGGILFYDAQVYNPERLVLAFVQSAAQDGAQVANYVEATGFLQNGDRVIGASVRDRLRDESFSIRAKMVVNAAGPWVDQLLQQLRGRRRVPQKLAKAFNVITRPIFDGYAVGLPGQEPHASSDDGGKRFFFFAPWRGRSIIGTDYIPYNGDPKHMRIHESEILRFLAAVNEAYPTANLTREDVTYVHGGLVPVDSAHPRWGVRLTKKDRFDDHRDEGISGLISVVGTKYTTARAVAEQVAKRLVAEVGQGQNQPALNPGEKRLYGGDIDDFARYLRTAVEDWPHAMGATAVSRLVYNYGSAHRNVARYLEAEDVAPWSAQERKTRDELAVLCAETRHAIHEEMAQTLADVVFRRTELGTAEYPGDQAIWCCAETMWREMNWDSARIEQEIEAVNALFERRHALDFHHPPAFDPQTREEANDGYKLATAAV